MKQSYKKSRSRGALVMFVLLLSLAALLGGCSYILKPRTEVVRTGPACRAPQRAYTRPAKVAAAPAAQPAPQPGPAAGAPAEAGGAR